MRGRGRAMPMTVTVMSLTLIMSMSMSTRSIFGQWLISNALQSIFHFLGCTHDITKLGVEQLFTDESECFLYHSLQKIIIFEMKPTCPLAMCFLHTTIIS